MAPCRRKSIAMLEKIQRRAAKLIPGLGDFRYEKCLMACGIPTLDMRRISDSNVLVSQYK